MNKVDRIYLSRWGEDITNELKQYSQKIADGKASVEFDVDYSDCYYESDEPSYFLLITTRDE